MYFTYILYSEKLQKRYIGYTDNLKERIEKHNNGFGSDFTSKGRPWKLIYYAGFANKQDAQAEELFLKSGKGRGRLKFLLRNTMDSMS